MSDLDDLDELMDLGAPEPSLYARHKTYLAGRWRRVMTRLRAVRPLPPEPLGTLVIGHAIFPIREPIKLDKGCFVVSGTTWNPFHRRLDRSVRTYRLYDPNGVLVRSGPIPDLLYGTVTHSAMSLTFTVTLECAPKEGLRHGP
jgi:hypothetical protein